MIWGGSRIFLGAALSLFGASCGGPAGPSDNPQPDVFSGTAVLVDYGGGFKVDVEGDFRSEGTLQAKLTWTMVAPGSGRYGAQVPRVSLEFFRECVGFECPRETVSAGPAPQGPLSVTATVHTASHYIVRIDKENLCGGCRIDYRLEVSHPAGSVRVRPPHTCPTYIVTVPRCAQPCTGGITNPVVDLGASPPQLRMREGERAYIAVQEAGCPIPDYDVESWSVTEPAVAVLEEDASGRPSFLRAMNRGQTRILASVIQVDGSRVQAELAYCSGSVATCAPTRLVLDVVP